MEPISISPVVLGIGVFLLLVLVGSFLFRKDTEIEQRRLRARKVSDICKEWGWSDLASVLDAYVVGDYSGIADQVKMYFDQLTDPTKAAAFFVSASKRHLDAAMKREESRDAILKAVAEYQILDGARKAAIVAEAKRAELAEGLS